MDLKELLPLVITSWQVLVTILALFLYMYLVGYVSSTHHRPPRQAKPKKKKKDTAAPAAAEGAAAEAS